jgi:type IV pilus assembly protein PilM
MPVIGLDLGSHSFRAVELERKKNQIVLNKFGSYANPRLDLDSGNKDDTDLYSNALKDFFSETGFGTPNVVVGLDESQVFMRIIKIPQMNDRELRNSVKYEAEQYIPLPINEVNLSYQKLDIDYADKLKLNIQLVAAKKTVLDRYVNIVKKANLIPKAIEPETIAIGRALGDTQESPMATLILDIGLARALIIIVYGGFVRFTRSIPIGGEVISKSIQQGLGLDFSQADEYKKVYGMDQNQVEGKIFNIVKPIIDNIILEVHRAAVFFTNHNPSANIKRVILTGGTALMPGLLLYTASNLDFEVELANSVKNITISDKLNGQKSLITEQAPLYSAAIGLALREI